MPNYKLKINIERVEKNLKQYLKKRMTKAVIMLEGYVKSHFGPSNLRGKNPSAPGSTPNVGMGTLRNSITHAVTTDRHGAVGAYGVRKGPASDYALRLEKGFYGTDSLGRNYNVAPRPYLSPAYRLNRKKIIQILRG